MTVNRFLPSVLRLVALRALCVVIALVAISAEAKPVEAIDDAGQRLVLAAPAKRIVSLAPHATELLFAAGLGPKVVGVSAYSDFPPAARELPSVGSLSALDVERIIALKPDLVIAWASGGSKVATASLRRLGIPVFVSDPLKLQQVAGNLRILSQLGGQAALGEQAAKAFEESLAQLRQAHAGQRQLSVFYQIWDDPLVTVNGRHSISEILALCGGRNIFAGLATLAPTVSLEAVLDADPQVIFASGSDAARPSFLDRWARWPNLRAVRADALIDIPPDLVQRPTPRLLEGAKRVCSALERVRARTP